MINIIFSDISAKINDYKFSQLKATSNSTRKSLTLYFMQIVPKVSLKTTFIINAK